MTDINWNASVGSSCREAEIKFVAAHDVIALPSSPALAHMFVHKRGPGKSLLGFDPTTTVARHGWWLVAKEALSWSHD